MVDYEQDNKKLLEETLKRAFRAVPRQTEARFQRLLDELAKRDQARRSGD